MVTTNIHGGQTSGLEKIKNQEIVQIGEEKTFNYSTLILWLAAAISICGMAFFWLMAKSTTEEIAEKEATKSQIVQDITSPQLVEVEKKASAFKSAVAELTTASTNRYKLSVFLPKFYEHIKKDISVENIAVTSDSKINFNGSATSYKSVAEQMMALQDWKVNDQSILKAVDILSVSESFDDSGNVKVTYSMTATINKGASLIPEAVDKSTENIGSTATESISSDSEGGLDGQE